MWKAAVLVALSFALEGAFILNAIVPDPGALGRAAAEARRPAAGPAVAGANPGAISAGAVARAR
jgi:hypothetical protein